MMHPPPSALWRRGHVTSGGHQGHWDQASDCRPACAMRPTKHPDLLIYVRHNGDSRRKCAFRMEQHVIASDVHPIGYRITLEGLMPRISFWTFLVVVFLSATVAAPAHAQQVGESIEVSVVNVEVHVTDKQGN